MIKNITIALLAFITIMAMSYAFVQKVEADKQRFYAEENYQRAVQQNKIAEEQRRLAEECRQMVESIRNQRKQAVPPSKF
jgi:hypothetical protein